MVLKALRVVLFYVCSTEKKIPFFIVTRAVRFICQENNAALLQVLGISLLEYKLAPIYNGARFYRRSLRLTQRFETMPPTHASQFFLVHNTQLCYHIVGFISRYRVLKHLKMLFNHIHTYILTKLVDRTRKKVIQYFQISL